MPTELTDTHQRALYEFAVGAITHAYAPYSRFKAGATALVDGGRFVSRRNVENTGYGVALCAEYGLVSEPTRIGGGRLATFACMDAYGRALAPCEHYHQLLSEHAADGTVLVVPSRMMSIDEVLPDRFCADDVEHVAGPQS